MPTLIVNHADGKTIHPFNRHATLGRSSRCTLCIKDIKLSRVHCEIVQDENDFVLVDLRSQNGTRVNDRLITEIILHDGDRISLGKSEVLFVTTNEAVATKAATEQNGELPQLKALPVKKVSHKDL